MNFLFSIGPTLIVLGVLILIHEFGHFIACRLMGVVVEKFSIGFGPEILRWQRKGTSYAISLLPLGGFVKPRGETVGELEDAKPRPGDYLAASIWARVVIVVAGVAMNYFLAFVLFALIFMAGRPVPGTTIGKFVDGYPAKTSGLQVGDRICQINGHKIVAWSELMMALEAAKTDVLALDVERKSAGGVQNLMIPVRPKIEKIRDVFGKDYEMRRLGIMPHAEANVFERYGLKQSIRRSAETVYSMTVMTYKAMFYLVIGKMSLKNLAGPIGIVSITGSAAKLGLPYVLQLTATLSVSLAVINLMPIPALDGGHLFFLLIEAVRRKPVSLAIQEKAAQIGFILLMGLMVLVLFNDLVNIAAFEKLRNLISAFRHSS